MLKKVVTGLVVLVAIVFAYRYYMNWRTQRAAAEGDVAGLGADPQTASGRSSSPTDTYAASPSAVSAAPSAASSSDSVKAKAADPVPTPAPAPAPAASATSTTSAPVLPASAPATDTLTPNAPNGMAFGGKGVYQWYRQGNLTWRINTQTGKSCIIYATMDEWRKEVVMKNGCGHSA